ncbi:cyclic nucleotide-binding domain-containing protein [Actinocrinis puniceicyclus]|uniref:Cyclic nucleotide-binding domain-containing protein n=1 Tax=Actinocrinis puniceicyclus TaxID=977794 RepID=A0A8J8BDX7_9ACTN|nr:cyclic nucleotide-binding domain-containing protein [Actinocrinis puniceicyclus]MBS2964626.1 cyclic nucleotide-binding domain-containing protein [Actinocrinis puniceicyclus]
MTAQMQTRVAAHPFLAALAPPQRELLAEDAWPVLFAAGERVFAEGAAAERFWLIETGSVALDIWVPGRGQQTVETLSAGTVLGWSWLYPPHRWHFGAQARDDVEAIAFDAAAVRRRCEADPAFGYAILRCFTPVIIERLQATRLRMLDLYASPDEAADTDARRAESPQSEGTR